MSRALLRFAFALTFACPAPSWAQAVPLEQSAFTAYIADRLKAATAGGSIEVTISRPLEISLKSSGGSSIEAYLDRLFSHCNAVKGNCAEAVRRYVESTSQTFIEESQPVERHMLRALVRDAFYVKQLNALHKARGTPPLVAKPYVGELWMVLAIDRPTSIRMVIERTLADLELSEPDAFALALKNIREAKPPILRTARRYAGTPFFILGQDDYESSRFLMHADWADVAKAQGGHLIASVPATNAVLFGRGETADDVRALSVLTADAAAKAPRKVSTQVFRWRADGWQLAQ